MIPRIAGNVRRVLCEFRRRREDGVIQVFGQHTHVVLQRKAAKIRQYVHDPFLCHTSVEP
jgi:hypothetical protein